VMCYAGLKSAIVIAEILDQKIPDRWHMAEDKLKKSILQMAWSKQLDSFVQTFEGDAQMDISVLSIEDYGLLHPYHHKLASTVSKIEKKLVTSQNAVKRFEDAAVPFYLPTLWLANHFIRVGDKKKASKYIDTALSASTDLNLCAEHFDPKSGAQYGNFPQTFSAAAFADTLIDFNETNNIMLLEIANYKLMDVFDLIKNI
jgi:GH15 family glucan-1,4-alpha-glucosidase